MNKAPNIPSHVAARASRYHWYVSCCEITFVDSQGDTGITRVNVMSKNDEDRMGVRELARAQQAAQIQLRSNLKEDDLNVLNVIFISISYLGHLTEAQFNERDAEV